MQNASSSAGGKREQGESFANASHPALGLRKEGGHLSGIVKTVASDGRKRVGGGRSG